MYNTPAQSVQCLVQSVHHLHRPTEMNIIYFFLNEVKPLLTNTSNLPMQGQLSDDLVRFHECGTPCFRHHQ